MGKHSTQRAVGLLTREKPGFPGLENNIMPE
jgi:hypothetical protein